MGQGVYVVTPLHARTLGWSMALEGDEPLPVYSDPDRMGDTGMRIVDRIVSDRLGWIFRDQTRKDFGIDALIEVVRRDRRVTGRLIAAQIKCGPSWFREPTADGSGFVYRGELKHLNYWLGHSLPVIVVICDPATEDCFYRQITAPAVEATANGWKTVIPRARRLSAESCDALMRMVKTPQREDIISLALLPYLVERWGDRLRICSITEAPRDFHRFPHLIEITGDTGGVFGVQFIDAAVRVPSAEAIQEEIEWRDHNVRATGGGVRDLMLLLVGDDPESTRLTPAAAQLVSRTERLRVHRLVYKVEWGVWLTEIDDDDAPVQFWPGADEPGD